MIKFTERNISKLEPTFERKSLWYFDCAMNTSCPEVFGHCEDNYEVEQILRKAKVLTAKSSVDTESCALVVNFSTKNAATAFISRLNKYIESNK
jgi:signal transduction histidine kinase